MRRLILVRHAKSSWTEPALTDHERPLNRRGQRVAPTMARYVVEQCERAGCIPGALVTSDAVRALATARAFADAFAQRGHLLVWQESNRLYHAEEEELFEVVWSLDEAWTDVVLVGHNPGLLDFVNCLKGGTLVDALPTAAVALLSFSVTSWGNVQQASGKLEHLWVPKKLGF